MLISKNYCLIFFIVYVIVIRGDVINYLGSVIVCTGKWSIYFFFLIMCEI